MSPNPPQAKNPAKCSLADFLLWDSLILFSWMRTSFAASDSDWRQHRWDLLVRVRRYAQISLYENVLLSLCSLWLPNIIPSPLSKPVFLMDQYAHMQFRRGGYLLIFKMNSLLIEWNYMHIVAKSRTLRYASWSSCFQGCIYSCLRWLVLAER